jgi:hypothetical protein
VAERGANEGGCATLRDRGTEIMEVIQIVA